jgi:hypothetical protein
LANGCDTATIYRPQDIDQDFMWENREILSQKRGAGYWLWKPYFIDRELNPIKGWEYLIYADAGVEFIAPISHITTRMQGDVWLFGNMWQHVHFCKADVMKAINCWNSGSQVQASVIIIRNTPKSREFVKEWLTWCTVSGMIDDSPGKCQNHPEFQEHRHDQAVLTTLAYREKITPFHWWPAMYNAGNFTYEKTGYNDNYPVLFHHHRLRNSDFTATDDLNRHMQKYFKSKYPFI